MSIYLTCSLDAACLGLVWLGDDVVNVLGHEGHALLQIRLEATATHKTSHITKQTKQKSAIQ